MKTPEILTAAAATALLTAASIANYRRFMPRAEAYGENRYPIDKKTITVKSGDHTLYGEMWKPKGTTGSLPTVICCHGYGSSYRLCVNMIGKSLAMSGFAAYCFDFYGGNTKSRSGGSMMEMSVLTEKQDLLHVIDEMRKRPEVDPDNLFLLGESQGGMVSAITAVERQSEIRAMILYYPAFCIPSDAHEKFASREDIPAVTTAFGRKISRKYYDDVWDLDIYREISEYGNPVLIMHGDADRTVDPEYGKRGAESYPDARFVLFPGEIHGFYGKGKRRAAKMSVEFLNEQLCSENGKADRKPSSEQQLQH